MLMHIHKQTHRVDAATVCLKRICSLDTSAFSKLEVLDDNCTIYIYISTYLLTMA